MRRSSLAVSVVLATAVALVGCSAQEPQPSEEPAASASPSATASATPSPSPSATPSEEPVAEPQCGDAYVIASTSGDTGFSIFPGTDEEVLAAAQPRAGFVAPEAIDGLDVLCTVTHLAPTNGEPGVVELSTAFIAPGPGAEEQLAAWATEHGYVADDTSSPYSERYLPRLADGSTTMKIVFAPIARFGGPDALGTRDWAGETGVAVVGETLVVTHSDFTIPQG